MRYDLGGSTSGIVTLGGSTSGIVTLASIVLRSMRYDLGGPTSGIVTIASIVLGVHEVRLRRAYQWYSNTSKHSSPGP